MTSDTSTAKMIADVKKNAAGLAMAAMLADHLHAAGFGISSIDEEGVRVFLTNRKVSSAEVQAAIPDAAAPYVQVYEDYLRPEDLVLVSIRIDSTGRAGQAASPAQRKGTREDNKSLLKTRHDEYVEEARGLIKALAARIEEKAVATIYDWGDVGDLTDLVDRLRELGPDWVGDKASDMW